MGINNNIFVRVFKSQRILLNIIVSHYAFLLTSHFLSFCGEGINRVYYQVILPVVTDGSNKNSTKNYY